MSDLSDRLLESAAASEKRGHDALERISESATHLEGQAIATNTDGLVQGCFLSLMWSIIFDDLPRPEASRSFSAQRSRNDN